MMRERTEVTVTVTCHNGECKKTFPVAPVAKQTERQEAKAIGKGGGGTLRVARWCPWCGSMNMVGVLIASAGNAEAIVYMGIDKGLDGLAPTPGEEQTNERSR